MIGGRDMRTKCLALSVLAALIVVPIAGSVAAQQAADPGAAAAASAGDGSVKALADAICAQVSLLQPDADASRVEADIVFALSQSGADAETQAAALQAAGPICLTGPIRSAALANALKGVQSGNASGTGAILARNGSGSFSSGSGFSSPGINVGGGSVNYSN